MADVGSAGSVISSLCYGEASEDAARASAARIKAVVASAPVAAGRTIPREHHNERASVKHNTALGTIAIEGFSEGVVFQAAEPVNLQFLPALTQIAAITCSRSSPMATAAVTMIVVLSGVARQMVGAPCQPSQAVDVTRF